MRQYVPWENSPNTKDENPSNYLSIIDKPPHNGFQQISKLLDKRKYGPIEKRDHIQQL